MGHSEALSEAFAKFSEASTRLEEKYEHLLAETKVLRETLKAKDLEIKKQERLALLGETAAAIAHEVRNPLGAIKLFVSLLKKDLHDKPEALKIADQIDASIVTLNNVVSNILQFSKERTMSVSPVNIHAIIQEQVHAFPRSEMNQATFDIALQASPYILGNDSGLRQVFYNVILNALQATAYSGRVSIKTSDVPGGINIEISDNGHGIPEPLMEKLFEPFITSKNEGTGLGLAIAKQIVEFHRGVITANNKSGAHIQITLPKNFKENEV